MRVRWSFLTDPRSFAVVGLRSKAIQMLELIGEFEPFSVSILLPRTSMVCEECGIYMVPKKMDKYRPRRFCGHTCASINSRDRITSPCGHCGKPVTKFKMSFQTSKSGFNFCGHSCSAKYSNSHKMQGTRRSRLEIWLEDSLRELYPWLDIHCNRNEAIKAELDFYLPTLNLAFEFNGILHYEPIYGFEKLASIRRNDAKKIDRCLDRSIELHVIDVSPEVRFTVERALIFLDSIRSIIDRKVHLQRSMGVRVDSEDPTRGKKEGQVKAKKKFHRVLPFLLQATEWDQEIQKGTITRSGIARKKGCHPTVVTRIMNLLYLPTDVQKGILNKDKAYENWSPKQAMLRGRRLRSEEKELNLHNQRQKLGS